MSELRPPYEADLLRRVTEVQTPGFTHTARIDDRFDAVVLTTGFSAYIAQSLSRQMLELGGDDVIAAARDLSERELVHALPQHVTLIAEEQDRRQMAEDQLFTYLSSQYGIPAERIARSYLGRTER